MVDSLWRSAWERVKGRLMGDFAFLKYFHNLRESISLWTLVTQGLVFHDVKVDVNELNRDIESFWVKEFTLGSQDLRQPLPRLPPVALKSGRLAKLQLNISLARGSTTVTASGLELIIRTTPVANESDANRRLAANLQQVQRIVNCAMSEEFLPSTHNSAEETTPGHGNIKEEQTGKWLQRVIDFWIRYDPRIALLLTEADEQWGVMFESLSGQSMDVRIETSLGHFFTSQKRSRLQLLWAGGRLYGCRAPQAEEDHSPGSAVEENVLLAVPSLGVDIDALLTRPGEELGQRLVRDPFRSRVSESPGVVERMTISATMAGGAFISITYRQWESLRLLRKNLKYAGAAATLRPWLKCSQASTFSRTQRARLLWRYAKGVIALPRRGSETFWDDTFSAERLIPQLMDWYKHAWTDLIVVEMLRMGREDDPVDRLESVCAALRRRASLPPGLLTEAELTALSNTPGLYSLAMDLNRMLKQAGKLSDVDRDIVARKVHPGSSPERPLNADDGDEGEANVGDPVWSALFFLCDASMFEKSSALPWFGGLRLIRTALTVLPEGSLIGQCAVLAFHEVRLTLRIILETLKASTKSSRVTLSSQTSLLQDRNEAPLSPTLKAALHALYRPIRQPRLFPSSLKLLSAHIPNAAINLWRYFAWALRHPGALEREQISELRTGLALSCTSFLSSSPATMSNVRSPAPQEERILIGNKWLMRHYLQQSLKSHLRPQERPLHFNGPDILSVKAVLRPSEQFECIATLSPQSITGTSSEMRTRMNPSIIQIARQRPMPPDHFVLLGGQEVDARQSRCTSPSIGGAGRLNDSSPSRRGLESSWASPPSLPEMRNPLPSLTLRPEAIRLLTFRLNLATVDFEFPGPTKDEAARVKATGVYFTMISEQKMALDLLCNCILLYSPRPRDHRASRYVLAPAASFASLFGDVESDLVCQFGNETEGLAALDVKVLSIPSNPAAPALTLTPPTGLMLSLVPGPVRVYRSLNESLSPRYIDRLRKQGPFDCPRIGRKRWRLLRIHMHSHSLERGFWRVHFVLPTVLECRGNGGARVAVQEEAFALETGRVKAGETAVRLQQGTRARMIKAQSGDSFKEVAEVVGDAVRSWLSAWID